MAVAVAVAADIDDCGGVAGVGITSMSIEARQLGRASATGWSCATCIAGTIACPSGNAGPCRWPMRDIPFLRGTEPG